MLEENMRRALVLSRGDLTVFVTRPISLVMLLISAGLLFIILAPAVRKQRETVFAESD
jgi:TctA family transporter